jgi:hypothetical protein
MHSLSLLQEALWKEQQEQGDNNSTEDLLQPSEKGWFILPVFA